MRHLDLFAGIGGFSLAAQWVGWETVGFCEIDPYCQKVLRKHWPDVPIYDDIRKLDGRSIGPVDIITGGYPCQPFSLAGERRGAADDRHLWPEAFRILREVGATWAVFENVVGHITMGLDQVLADLESIGYAWETFVIPACAVDAPHRRDRVWIVANANGAQCQRGGVSSGIHTEHSDSGLSSWWAAEPDVDRVAARLPNRTHRLRALGNSVVPQVAEVIFRAINEVPAE